jgi:acyl-homoserine lactone acylase PvdQ
MRKSHTAVTVALLLATALLALATVSSAAAAPGPGSASASDFAGKALNVLPPGQSGAIPPGVHSRDQIPLYDGLTPLFDRVTTADLDTFFKPAIFGLGGRPPARVETPPQRPGLRIERDGFDVPHIFSSSRDDVMFGSGWVAAEDRGVLIEILRGPGRLAAIDPPGINAFAIAGSLRRFEPSAQTEQFLARQTALLENAGPKGQRVLADIRNYVAGINAYRQQTGSSIPPWTETDVLAVASLIAAIFGKGGGDEARRAELLSALAQRLDEQRGQTVWDDLRELQDPETSVSLDRSFKYGRADSKHKGNAVIDDGSLDTSAARASAVARRATRSSSNALLVGAERSVNGHPLFVAGPQVGYFYPQILMEIDLHGGGIDARGATFPGAAPYVLLGRGKDFSWSATSAGSDIIDQYVEELCGDDTHYRFRGECREMTTFDAGFLGPGGGEPGREIVFRETVHGPVIGYATVDGRRVAISQKRSTRGREGLSAFGFADLNTNTVDSAESFFRTMNQIEFTFNWFYADDRDIAMFSSGRLPRRHPQIDPGLPTIGTGKFEWRSFLPLARHPHQTNTRSGVIVNWNNKPAPGFAAADDNWAYGSVHRNELLEDAIERRQQHTLTSVVAAMNRAATQDLRNAQVLPTIADVLATGPAPNARAARMLALLRTWRAAGSSRLDRDLDGKIDHPGAAIMDAAWPLLADAVMSPVLGPQLDLLARLIGRDNRPNSGGSAYGSGWYGYVDKDLRALLGQPVTGPFSTRFCGEGNLASCRDSLWSALDAAGDALQSQQGPNPAAWRADATAERIRFVPGILPDTMRWTNRPTFQQVITFSGHR